MSLPRLRNASRHAKTWRPELLERQSLAFKKMFFCPKTCGDVPRHTPVRTTRLASGVQTCRLTTYSRQRFHSTSAYDGGPTIDYKTEELQPGHTVANITIANPKKLNIVSTALLDQLNATCKKLSTDATLRAVILTGGVTPGGRAPAFIGGADINEMYRLAGPDEARQFITRVHLACKAIRDLPVPVVARVHGYCLGAGLELMASCDLRIASEASVFGMPEVKVGIPSVVEAALLPGLIGIGRTRRLLYVAENIDARQAEAWGLVERVVRDEVGLDAAVHDWIGRICGAGSKAIREQKRLIQRWEECSVSEGIEAGIDSFAKSYKDGGIEPKNLMGRFLKKG